MNTQTEGAVPDQVRRAAEPAGLPVVEVTEAPPDGTDVRLVAARPARRARDGGDPGEAGERVTADAVVLDDVQVVRGGRTVWSDGSFRRPHGSVVIVIGPNGSGKTTLLQLLLGLLTPASGQVTVLG